MKKRLFLLAVLAMTATAYAQQQLTNIVVWSTNANGVALRVTNSVTLSTNLLEAFDSSTGVGFVVGEHIRAGTVRIAPGTYGDPFIHFKNIAHASIGVEDYGSDNALMLGGSADGNHEWVIIRVRDDPHYIFHSDYANFRSPLVIDPYAGGAFLFSITNSTWTNLIFHITDATDPLNTTLMFAGSATFSNNAAFKRDVNVTSNFTVGGWAEHTGNATNKAKFRQIGQSHFEEIVRVNTNLVLKELVSSPAHADGVSLFGKDIGGKSRLGWVTDDYTTNIISVSTNGAAVGDYLRIHSITGSLIIWTNKP